MEVEKDSPSSQREPSNNVVDIGQESPPEPHSRFRTTPDDRGFSVTAIVILWSAAIICAVIPYTLYLSPILFLAGLYYGWKIWRRPLHGE